MSNKFLFCADFQPASKTAFEAVLAEARQSKADLIVLYVLEPCQRYSGVFITDNGEACLTAELAGTFNQKLQKFYVTPAEKTHAQHVEYMVCGGIPAMEILRVARKEKVDRIIMGSLQTAGDSREGETEISSLGETAWRVYSRARCPVFMGTSQLPASRAFESTPL